MTYAILQISAAAYADIRARIVAIDERLRIAEYVPQYIRPAAPGRHPEHLVFGPVGFEALPPERPQDDRWRWVRHTEGDQWEPALCISGEGWWLVGRGEPVGDVFEVGELVKTETGREIMNGDAAESLDARRWRALMTLPRIRMHGSAGFNHKTGARDREHGAPTTYVHFGAEFWSDMGPDYDRSTDRQNTLEWGRFALTAIADAMIERGETSSAPASEPG